MALIDTTHLLDVADRAAKQYQFIKEAFDSLVVEGGGFYFDIVTDTDDADVEIPTVENYQFVDDRLVSEGAAFAVKKGTRMALIISAMEAHFNRSPGLQAGGWDGYAVSNNVRYSDFFAQFFFAVKSRFMLAINIFSEGDDLFGTVDIVGGPAITYTDGINYGNGSDLNPADGTKFAATQLRIKVITLGATDLDLRLSVKDINNNPTTIDVNIPGSTAGGSFITVGISTDRFLDVLGVTFVPAMGTGTVGDDVEIRNLKERTIAL